MIILRRVPGGFLLRIRGMPDLFLGERDAAIRVVDQCWWLIQ